MEEVQKGLLTEYTQRIHFPRPINHLKGTLKHTHQAPRALHIPHIHLFVLIAPGNQSLHLLNKLIQNPRIHQPQYQQKCRRHRGSNDSSYTSEAIKALAEGCGRRCDNDGSNYYYSELHIW